MFPFLLAGKALMGWGGVKAPVFPHKAGFSAAAVAKPCSQGGKHWKRNPSEHWGTQKEI